MTVAFDQFLNVAAAVEIRCTPFVYANNINDDGLYIEWRVTKTSKQDPDIAEIAIHNLHTVDRELVHRFAETPPGLPALLYPVVLKIGWDGKVQPLFQGNMKHLTPDGKHADPVNAVTFMRVVDGAEVTEKNSPEKSAWNKWRIPELFVAFVAGKLNIRPTAAGLALIKKAAAKLPFQDWRAIGIAMPPAQKLNAIFETLRLSWSVQGGQLIVYDRGVNNEAPLVSLSYSSGLLSYEIKNKGTVLVRALAIPAVVPGGPLEVYGKDGKLVTGALLRVDSVVFSGNTDGKSTMRIVARPPKGA